MISNISQEIEKQNADVRAWTSQTQNALRNNIRSLSTKGKGELARMTHQYFRQYGEINRISFRFPRHGVFFAKGVGRGYRSKNGKVYKVESSRTQGFNRHPKDWFNSELDKRVPMLAEMVGQRMAQAAVNATNAKIR